MYSIWLSLLIILSVNIIIAANLRCNEDTHGSFQVIENCRACVIFIAPATAPTTTSSSTTKTTTTKTTTTAASTALPKHIFATDTEPSIEELFLFDERKRRRRHSIDTVIHQECAREYNGPLYGYDQTHCYCNSNQCNANIQRCIYEVTSKRHFACYHGTNSSQSPLEIRHKCRSCRIRIEPHLMFHYECLTFGEREQSNQSHCTCQQPMCNQDVSACQRSHQGSSRPRAHPAHGILISSTSSSASTTATTTTTTTTTTTESTSISTTTTTTTSTTITTTTTSLPSTTPITTTLMTTTTPLITSENIVTKSSTMIETESEMSTENTTIIESTTITDTTTSFIEIKHLKTVYIQVKSQANSFSSLTFTLFQAFLFLFIYSM